MSDVEHVKLRSGMYVGSTAEEEREALCAVVGEEGAIAVKRRRVTVVPALLKLFDEVISNALDEACKGRGVTAIKITVSADTIVVHNNGEGIVTGMHSVLGVPVIQARGKGVPSISRLPGGGQALPPDLPPRSASRQMVLRSYTFPSNPLSEYCMLPRAGSLRPVQDEF